jgi:hypothetical protein
MLRAALWFSVVFFCAGVTPALAYIDPGIGSLFQQGLVALVASGAVLFFSFRDRLARLFGKTKDQSENAGGPKD